MSQVIWHPAPYGLKDDNTPHKANETQKRVLQWARHQRIKQEARRKSKDYDKTTDHIPILYLQGGVGCGKSRAAMAATVQCLTEIPRIRVLWGRHDMKDIEMSIVDKFFEVVPSFMVAARNKQYGWYDIKQDKGNTARVFFSGLKDLSGLGSQEFGLIVVTEVHEMSQTMLPALKRRARQAGVVNMIIMEGEAPNEGHWLSNVCNPAHADYDQDVEKWELSTYENWDNLPAAYRGSLERMPDAWKRKYLMGKCGFQPSGKPYYSGFMETIHSAEIEWIRDKPLLLGWDFGYHHPACIVTQIDLYDRWCWLREIIGTDITIDKFGDHVKEQLNFHYPGAEVTHYGDPAVVQKTDKSEFTSWEILAEKKILIHYRASKYRQRKEIIERKLSTLNHGKPQLMADSRYCRTAVEGFLGGYHYPEIKGNAPFGAKFELPFKDGWYEHIMNAGEYIAVNMFSPVANRKRNQRPSEAAPMDNI